MKKVVLLLITSFGIGVSTFAQDINKAKTYLMLKQYESAKTEIDQFTINPKANAEAWYTKAQVYIMLAIDSALKIKYPNAQQTALEAFKKYVTLDPSYKLLQEDKYSVINNLYIIAFNDGVIQYNQKKYVDAIGSFQQAVWVSDEMIKNKWSKALMDTNAILYAGASAQNAKKEEDAIVMYKRLVDQKIVGEGYQGIYEFVADYYRRKKDDVNFQKYIVLGKQLYPEDRFWLASEMEVIKEKGDFNALVTMYENMIAKSPTYDLYFELGTAVYDYLYPRDTIKNPKNNVEGFEQKMLDAYTKATEIKKEEGLPYFNIGNHYYNKAVGINKLYNAIRNSKKPEDIKKKEALLNQSNNYVDQAIAAYEKACERFSAKNNSTATEKFCHKNSASALIDLHKDKKASYKPTTPEYKKYDEAEKKWAREYDRLDKIKE